MAWSSAKRRRSLKERTIDMRNEANMIHRFFPAVFLFLGVCTAVEQTGCALLFAAQSSAPSVKIMASYGGELGYQAPLWVAHDLKLFAKQGISSELIPCLANNFNSCATQSGA